MANFRSAPRLPMNPDSIFYWLADLLSSQQDYGEWIVLADPQRSQWLDANGYDHKELGEALHHYTLNNAAAEPALVRAMQQFLDHGEPIPGALLDPLQSLIMTRVNHIEAIAGGVGIGSGRSLHHYFKPNLLTSFRAMQGSLAEANKLYNEASESRLGLYVDVVGGIQEKATDHVDQQVSKKQLEVASIKEQKHAEAKELKAKETLSYKSEKSAFIAQKEDTATQKEQQLLSNGTWNQLDLASIRSEKGENLPPAISTRAKEVIKLDRSYYEDEYKADIEKNMITKPTFTRDTSGTGKSVTMSYDWKGDRGTVALDKRSLAIEQDTILRAFNILTAKALWSSHVKQQVQVKQTELSTWRPTKAMGLHPSPSQKILTSTKSIFPKAKVPATIKQAQQERQSGIKTLKEKQQKAKRHGVTTFSIQRQRDEKKLLQREGIQATDPKSMVQSLTKREAKLRASVVQSLESMALAHLVADSKYKLSSSSKFHALVAQHASITSWKQAFVNTDSSISFSDRKLNISWTQGAGLNISRASKDPSAKYAADPSLSLSSHNNENDSLNLSVNYSRDRISYESMTSRDEGALVRQHGNSYTISSTEAKGWDQIQSKAQKQTQLFEKSLENSSFNAVKTKERILESTNKDPRLLKLLANGKGLSRAEEIHSTFHDILIDRKIESKLTHQYGSLRSQKIMMNQTLNRVKKSQIDADTIVKRARRIDSLLSGGDKKLHDEKILIDRQLEKGMEVDKRDGKIIHRVYNTNPYGHLVKSPTGGGYAIITSTTSKKKKDYWQTLSQKQRYAVFNPIYLSEKTFYGTEKAAFLAGKATYIDLRHQGASKKMARMGASEVYFSTLLAQDDRQLKYGYSTEKLAYAPFIFKRQLHIVKQVIYLNRHASAWKLRVGFKVKREKFLYNHIVKYHQYMVNNKFTGFHPFHRMARFTVHKVSFLWKHSFGPIVHAVHHLWKDEIGALFGHKAASWMGHAFHKVNKTIDFIGWHAIKGLWHLPERLYKHGKFFLHQALFAMTHPWEYRKIWGGIKRDFRGPWRMLKFAWHIIAYSQTVLWKSIIQVGKSFKGTEDWHNVVYGAYHKKLYHKMHMIGEGMKFAGLASLVGKTKLTQTAVAIERMKMHLRRDLHKTGFASAAWRHAIKKHKKLVDKYKSKVIPAQADGLVQAAKNEKKLVRSHKKKIVSDIARAKVSSSYRAQLKSEIKAKELMLSSYTGRLKPAIQATIHSDIHKAIDKLSSASHKSKKVKKWTARQWDRDITTALRAYTAYSHLDNLGKKELAYGTRALLDATKASKKNLIKDSVAIINSNVKDLHTKWKSFFKSSKNSTSYGYALKQDWTHMGQYIGGALLSALQKSIYNTKAMNAISTDITNDKLGKKTFDDIIGGFWIHHYLQLIQKDSGFMDHFPAVRRSIEAVKKTVDVVLKQPAIQKIFQHWLKLNPRSSIAKDYLKLQAYHQHVHLSKDLRKWRRIEKIGNTQITTADLASINSLHKNQLLGTSLAEVTERTAKWQGLSLTQKEQYRDEYNTWLSYNQTKGHGLDTAIKNFNKKDQSESAAWKADQAEIEADGSLSVGSILLSVKNNDDNKHYSWTTIPKPRFSQFNQHLSNTVAYLQHVAHDPGLLAVNIEFTAANHSKSKKEMNPSLLGFYGQTKVVRHKYKWIKEKIYGKDPKEVEKDAEKDARKTEEDIGDTKKEVQQQVQEAKNEIETGQADQGQLVQQAAETDGKDLEALSDEKRLKNETDDILEPIDKDHSSGHLAHEDEQHVEDLAKEDEDGEIKISDQQAKRMETQEEDDVTREAREDFSTNKELRETKDVVKEERDITSDDGLKSLRDESEDSIKHEEKDLVKDDVHETDYDPGRRLETEMDEDIEAGEDSLSESVDSMVEESEVALEETEVFGDDLIEIIAF